MENLNLNPTNNLPYNTNYTLFQLKLPLILEEIIEIDDPVYTFVNLIEEVNLNKYLVSSKKTCVGRTGYNPLTLFKVVLFAFQLKGYASTREIADLCRNDIRFRYLLQNEKSYPTHMTISNFINKYLTDNIENIFKDIMNKIVEINNIDLDHAYIDGTKIEANANKYTWVWKKACITNRDKLFTKITSLLNSINDYVILYTGTKYGIRDVYEIEYLELILNDFTKKYNIDTKTFVHGKGARKTIEQRFYELLLVYLNKLKEYAKKIEICGDVRNSYSKTDHDATFMRMKTDYMGNDQLLPAYNLQYSVCDEFITCLDINQYASDSDCFIPLMENFKKVYGKYPTYTVADAGYGSYNNYIYCEQNNMKKYMKFGLYKKETQDKKYKNNIFRVSNFKTNDKGELICPNNKIFIKIGDRPVKNNKYGRTEEIYECSSCENCSLKSECTKSKGNRRITLNKELTKYHKEVIENLESLHGALLRMNRSIQVEGAFGILKQDRHYRRIVRKGLDKVKLESYIIALGFNFYKLHNKKKRNLI